MHLLGSTGEEVKSRRVPLRLVLMYENMHRVHNQEILKLSPDSKLVIDEHGKATLRVRIEEVSKNHQKQVESVGTVMSEGFLVLNLTYLLFIYNYLNVCSYIQSSYALFFRTLCLLLILRVFPFFHE